MLRKGHTVGLKSVQHRPLFFKMMVEKCLMWHSAGCQNPLESDELPAGSDPWCILQVKRTYSQGTYRAGAMRQVSLVGAVDEEVGDFFPEFIRLLEDSPFLVVSSLICVFTSIQMCQHLFYVTLLCCVT